MDRHPVTHPVVRWAEEGNATVEGTMAGILLEEALVKLAAASRSFELVITCADGRIAAFYADQGELLGASLGPERDPVRVLAILAGIRPVRFRLRPLRLPAEGAAAGPVHELLAQAQTLAEELPTMVLWMNQLLEGEEYELRETRPMSLASALRLEELETLKLVREDLPPQPVPARGSAPVAMPSWLLVALTACGLSGMAMGGMVGSVLAALVLVWTL